MKNVCSILLALVLTVACAERKDAVTQTPQPKQEQCSAVETSTGAEIRCPDGSVVAIKNGPQGAAGSNGSNGADGEAGSSTEIVVLDPCGDAPGITDLVILQLSNGTLVASFSDNSGGKNTRFTVLSAGTYVTTDGDECSFSVDANGEIYGESHSN